ncbi:putative Ig domain-containing protein [Pseudoalteromonas sp. SMS1]|uniref:putative Ig domain-containing protein n=1 Tax=Pseudoalteromonas sp. SMS1 TaxID=2908894 RepID=UPI001F43F8B7|nr:putative Ig domain-containing protein [Pseudoalteromonas sp. SMS1]MCF2860475.1 putative Ig domain-containing protein [Pseudoalteromonas sp. SMS1]
MSDARVSHSVYNGAGQLTQITHADNTTESYTYYDNGLKATYTNQKGATWDYTYDNSGRLAYEHGPAATHHYWYNGALVQVDQARFTKSFDYDDAGNVIKITEGVWKGNGWVANAEQAVSRFTYDLAGRQVSVNQDATRNAPATESRTVYDVLGRAVLSTQGADLSQPASASNPHVTQLKVYDNAGNVRFEVSGAGNVTQRQYNALGQVVKLIQYADQTTVRTGPSHDLVLSDLVDSQGAIRSGNPLNLAANTSQDRTIVTAYDNSGRKVRVDIGNQSTQFKYNAFGQEVKSEKLLSGEFNTSGYNALTQYTYYNELGQKVAMLDAGKYLTKWDYNAFGAVKMQTEYAVAIAGNPSEDTIPNAGIGNDTVGQNRVIEYHYDEMGRVLHQVQSNVDIADFTSVANFESHNHLISSFEYDDLGNTISSQKRTANTGDLAQLDSQTFGKFISEYDALGRLIHTASESVAKTQVDTSQTQSKAITITTGRRYTTMAYDAFGNMVKRTEHANTGSVNSSSLDITVSANSQDKSTQHEYNVRGQLISEYDALGNKVLHHYNALGQLVETRQTYNEWHHDNEHYSFSYQYYYHDASGKSVRTSGKLGGLPSGISFDPNSGILKGKIAHIQAGDYSTSHTTVTISLDANYLSPDSDKNQYRAFDSRDASKGVAAFSSWRKPTSGSDSSKQVYTQYFYDENGQLSRKTLGKDDGNGDASIKSYYTYYNAFGEVKKDEDGQYLYNKEGLLWKTTKEDGVLKTHEYDKAGRLTSTIHALNGQTDIERDALGNATKIKQPKFTQNNTLVRPEVQQTFDRWGNTIELKDALGFITKMAYNHSNQVIKEILPSVNVTDETGVTKLETPINLYHYDEAGRLIQKVDANLNTHTFKYDESGKQTLTQDGEGNLTYHRYDAFGRKVVTTDAEGKVTTTHYDKLDRVVETGQFGVVDNVSGTYRTVNSYDYDELGNRTHERDALGGEKSYKFDVYGNVIYSRDEVGREKSYSYNSDGTQKSETYINLHSSSNANKHQNSRLFDEYGNLQSGNDLGGKGFNYTYGRSFGSTKVKTLNSTYQEIETTNIGRLIRKKNDRGQNIEYRYYDNGWLKSITDKTTDAYSYFEYDKAGRRTLELTQSWDDLKRVIRHETETKYDSHGRILQTQTNEYKNTNATGTPNWVKERILSRVTYRYDAVGNRRSMKVENGITGAISENPEYIFHGSLLLEENQQLNSESSSVAQFFDTLQISRLSYSAQIYKQNDQSRWESVSSIDGLTLNSDGTFSGVPSYDSSGVYRLEVEAKDSSVSPSRVFKGEIEVFISNVKAPIEMNQIARQSGQEGYSFSVDLSQYFTADSTSRELKYVVRGLPSTLSYDQSGMISGKLGYEDSGNHTITVEVSDKNDASIKRTQTFTLNVKPTNHLTVKEGHTHSINLLQESHGASLFELTKGASFVKIIRNQLVISPLAGDARSTPYIIGYKTYEPDPEGNKVTGTYEFHVHVPVDTSTPANLAPTGTINDKQAKEGQFFSHNTATNFKDPDGDEVTYSAYFFKRVFVADTRPIDTQAADLSLEQHQLDGNREGAWEYRGVEMPGGLRFSASGVLSGTPYYTTAGLYRVIVVATETKSTKLSGQAEFNLSIANVNPNRSPTVTLSGGASVLKGKSITLTAKGNDPDGTISAYEWQSSSGLSVTGRDGSATVTGLTGGEQWVKVRVKDNDGTWSSWKTKSITVTLPSVVNRAPVANRSLGTFGFQGRGLNYLIPDDAFSDPDGDTLTYSASGLPNGLSLNGNRISGPLNSPGTFYIQITAKDPKGLSAKTTLRLEVEPRFTSNTPGIGIGTEASGQVEESQFLAQTSDSVTQKAQLGTSIERAVNTTGSNSTSGSVSSTSTQSDNIQEYWFTYDGNNRVVHDGGSLSGGKITTKSKGQFIAYNDVGQQTLVVSRDIRAQQFIYNSWGQVAAVDSYQHKGLKEDDLYEKRAILASNPALVNWVASSRLDYDALGRVTDKREYYGATSSETFNVGGNNANDADAHQDDNTFIVVNYGGAIKRLTETRYNAAGDVVWVQEKALTLNIEDTLRQQVKPDLLTQTIFVSDGWSESNLGINSTTQDYVYDGAGMVKSYSYYQKAEKAETPNLVHNFTKEYIARDQYLESLTKGEGSKTHPESQHLYDAQTKSSYDVNGNRTRIEEHITDSRYTANKDVNARYMRYDAEGKLISKVTGKQSETLTASHLNTQKSYYNPQSGEVIDWQTTVASNVGFEEDESFLGRGMGSYYLYSGGNYLGELNKSGTNSIKEQHFKAPDARAATVVARHQVQSGNTLKELAKLYYGNENLWYIIADFNGLGAGSDLQAGVMLDIPARANTFNSHDSFKPINLGEVIGDTTPSMPYVPPPPEAGCNVFASVIMIAVAVVATIATAGALAGASYGALMSTGTSVLTGSFAAAGVATTGAGIAMAATAGFVGSAVSQLAGKAMGVVDSFSLKSALGSGLTAGLTAGAGHVLRGVEAFAKLNDANKAINVVSNAGKTIEGVYQLGSIGKAAVGAAGAISSVAANKLVGNEASFRWGNVAASALTSYVGAELGFGDPDTLAGGMTSGDIVTDTLGGIANSGLRYGSDKLFGNEASWNFKNIATDAFGNALGNSIVSGLSSTPKSANTTATSPKRAGQTQPIGKTGGAPASQDAVDINPENALERWNRLEASGGLDSLSDNAYYSLATAANSIENATRPITSFDRFNHLVNHSNMIRQQLNNDLATKAQSVQRTQSLIANNQAWIDRNTTTMGRVPQGFDLESSLIDSIDWTDMSQPLTPGPWREGYVFGSPNTQSNLTTNLGYASLTVGGLGSTHTALSGIAATKPGSYSFGLVQNKGWTLADKAPLSTIFDGSFGRGASTPLNGVSNYSFGFGPVDDIKSLTGSISGLMDSSLAQTSGRLLTAAGPMVSGFQAYDYQFNQENHNWNNPANQADIASNWGKFGVDSTFALASITGVGTLPATVYGITDFALQASGYSYTPKFHPTEMGVEKKSWTGLMYQFGDMIEANQRINPNFKVRGPGGF